MAQSPFLIDQLQIEPGTTGTRLVRRKTTDNSLELVDGVAGSLSLKMLAGSNLGNTLTVGSGVGAQYTTIQAAVDAIPVGTDAYTVLVGPGVYPETVTVSRTNVSLVGLGYPTITQSVGHGICFKTVGGVTPYQATVYGFNVNDSDVSSACVRLEGGAGSDVGQGGIEIIDCNLTNSAGGKTLWATSMCIASMYRCTMGGNASVATVTDCGAVAFYDMGGLGGYDLSFDTGGTLPSLTTGDYRIERSDVGPSGLDPMVSASVIGGGSFFMVGCLVDGNVAFSGDQSAQVMWSNVSNVTLNNTVAATFVETRHGSVTAAAGATLGENLQQGVASFVADTTKAVVFTAKQPDTAYVISLEPNNHGTYISARSVSGFTITAGGVTTADVPWTVTRAQV